MAALESPLVASPGNVMSAFSPYTEFSVSPHSPAPPQQRSPHYKSFSRAHNSTGSSGLRPGSFDDDGLSPASAIQSPMSAFSDTVGPSPVTSNGTNTTDIDDEMSVEAMETGAEIPRADSQATLKRLSTNVPDRFRSSASDESTSVIHAPQGYQTFISREEMDPVQPVPRPDRQTPTPFQKPGSNHTSPRSVPPSPALVAEKSPRISRIDRTQSDSVLTFRQTTEPGPRSPPIIFTSVSPTRFGLDNMTPRAHTREDVEALAETKPLSRSNSLEGIPEERNDLDDEFYASTVQNQAEEITALRTALHECWTLCNTLASLSSIHRERIFTYSGTRDAHVMAWKCCWKLCKKLYDSQDEDHQTHVRPTLDMCRDFCQSLFDVRQKKDETADSVLRVSFELNNHLYNTHDRNLPEAFRERTLDFYITLCHRLMKQRNELAEETDALLRACWSLAEMLFSLRQNKHEGKTTDEELLGSAVQACWELCDLFRDGWTQVRPERGTPRPSQTTFSQLSDQMSRSSHASHSRTKSGSLTSLSELGGTSRRTYYPPETPVTEFEDTPISPGEESPHIPNILVLGTENNRSMRWSSANSLSGSSLSSYSHGSARSTNTVTAAHEDLNLTRLKILILKAAMNVGYSRNSPPSSNGAETTLQTFVKALPSGSFGSLQPHVTLLTSYRALVMSDPTFRSANSLPPSGKKASAVDVAKSVSWMMRSGQYAFLKDLFKMVFGFQVEEAENRKHVGISV